MAEAGFRSEVYMEFEDRIGQKFEVDGDIYTVVGCFGDYWHLLSDTTGVMEDGLLKTEDELLALKEVC